MLAQRSPSPLQPGYVVLLAHRAVNLHHESLNSLSLNQSTDKHQLLWGLFLSSTPTVPPNRRKVSVYLEELTLGARGHLPTRYMLNTLQLLVKSNCNFPSRCRVDTFQMSTAVGSQLTWSETCWIPFKCTQNVFHLGSGITFPMPFQFAHVAKYMLNTFQMLRTFPMYSAWVQNVSDLYIGYIEVTWPGTFQMYSVFCRLGTLQTHSSRHLECTCTVCTGEIAVTFHQ